MRMSSIVASYFEAKEFVGGTWMLMVTIFIKKFHLCALKEDNYHDVVCYMKGLLEDVHKRCLLGHYL